MGRTPLLRLDFLGLADFFQVLAAEPRKLSARRSTARAL